MTEDEELAAAEALAAEAEELAAITELLAENARKEREIMLAVLGPLPAWVPRPILGMVWRQVDRLRVQGIDPLEIRRQADIWNNGGLISNPASVHLHVVYAINDIANFLFALEMDKLDGLRELAGPFAESGAKFHEGRKQGTVGPVRALVGKLLKAEPEATTAQLWEAVSKNPPRGWQAFDNSQGKYLEGPKGGENMSYRRFENICSEDRKRVKGKITG